MVAEAEQLLQKSKSKVFHFHTCIQFSLNMMGNEIYDEHSDVCKNFIVCILYIGFKTTYFNAKCYLTVHLQIKGPLNIL